MFVEPPHVPSYDVIFHPSINHCNAIWFMPFRQILRSVPDPLTRPSVDLQVVRRSDQNQPEQARLTHRFGRLSQIPPGSIHERH